MKIKKHLKLLGMEVEDKVTGFKGVVSSISFDLYGCIQCVITPKVDKEGQTKQGQWFDIARIELKSDIPVMDCPNFDLAPIAEGKKGAAEKPPIMKV
jgi:hypothetical protein